MLTLLKHYVKRAFLPSYRIACDNYALTLLRPYDFPYLPWTAAAIRPASLCALLNEVLINRRTTLVEFGAGISTLYLAKAMKHNQGTLVSFEHDREWRDSISATASEQGLGEFVDIVYAPLHECDSAVDGCLWYDTAIVRELLKGRVVDGVVVDGPPANSPSLQMARLPALSIVREYLGESFFLYLDDISRVGESRVFERWQEALQMTGTTEVIAGDFGILRKGSRFAFQTYSFD